jgi:Ca-activated chloride channel family protein
MKKKIFLAFGIVFCTVVFSFVPTKADGIIIPEPPICDPCPIPSPMSQLIIRYHHVTVTIEGQIATTHVDQVFYNPNDWDVEGDYVFPVPAEAAVTDFVLWMDGKPVQGEILDADQARQIYEDIVTKLRDPALLEYADMGAMRARVFPIPPKGERRIELEYAQTLTSENGLVRYTYPLGTEKFSLTPLENVSITVEVAAKQPIRAIYSPSHPISISREGDFQVIAGYEENDVLPDQDFVLFYSIGEAEAFHLMTFRNPSDLQDPDGFFLLLLAPGFQESVRIVPKDVLIVLDRSGSMEGEKYEQAQEAIRYILNKLNPEDRFNLVAFSTGVDVFANGLQLSSKKDEAISWINQLRAEGSTDINRALLEASSMLASDRPSYLIFLTDGLPTVGEVNSENIIANLNGVSPENLSLFAFGVGYDVDTYLLDSLAQAHHGSSTYVVPGEPLDEILSDFYNKISAPVLTNLNLDFGNLITSDIYPHPLPDLFVGSQIAVVGRYRQGGISDVVLSGSVNGHSQEFVYPDQIFEKSSIDSDGAITSLPSLWATRKIGYLLQQVRLNGPEREIVDEIVELSIRYGIVTPYTSYLVTEPLPLGTEEQERISAEEFNKFNDQATLPTFGRQAVEEAEGQSGLANADAVVSAPVEAFGKVRTIGSHTFIYSDGVWMDTMYDPEKMKPIEIEFLSDEYFMMVRNKPELANAFALGMRVIVLSGEEVYEVVANQTTNNQTGAEPVPTIINSDQSTPVADTPIPDKTGSAANNSLGNNSLPCLGGLLVSLLPLMALGMVRMMNERITSQEGNR